MLSKEQMFVINDFITENYSKQVCNISDKLYDLVFELIKINQESKPSNTIIKTSEKES